MTHQHSISKYDDLTMPCLPFIFFHLNSGPDREERWIDPQMFVLLTICLLLAICSLTAFMSASQVSGELLTFDFFDAPAIMLLLSSVKILLSTSSINSMVQESNGLLPLDTLYIE